MFQISILIISLNLKGHTSFDAKKEMIRKSGFIAGFGLLLIYAGLIAVGAVFGSDIEIDNALSNDMQRANLLRGISIASLGWRSYWATRFSFYNRNRNSCSNDYIPYYYNLNFIECTS